MRNFVSGLNSVIAIYQHVSRNLSLKLKPSPTCNFRFGRFSFSNMAPIAGNGNFDVAVQKYIDSNHVMIFSKTTCPFCSQVKGLFQSLNVEFNALELNIIENGDKLHEALKKKVGRTSVPQVFVRGQHIGGCDDTLASHADGRLLQLLSPEEEETSDVSYDYDLIVIGGGSGGLAASKEAAKLGKKVAVFDFVKPTPMGTSWGLGGTCVNVGCIPKKLMHQAAILGHSIDDSRKFGWEVPDNIQHKWDTMRGAIQDYIGSLNWGYRVALRENSVQYVNNYASFVEPHKIKAVDKRGQEKLVTAKHFIIATGERPRYPDIPGAKEYGITSDDLFSLQDCPGKTLVVGASYVALECAGFLAGIGLDTTVMVRSIFLRGFDQDMAERIGDYMKTSANVKFLRPCIPVKVEQIEPRRLKVTGQMLETGEMIEEEYENVVFAIGRDACTTSIGLDTVGINVNSKNLKIPTVNEQTTVPHIFAIGDIVEGKPELTPVAIEAGILLARRLYGGSNIQCDYNNIPTTVFTPLEYGCIGLSEEAAIEKYGEDNIEVYHSNFTPLEWSVPKRDENICYAKLICVIPENERVVGFHYLGPNAGEVTQGFALGLRLGATKSDFDRIIGIHPTCAEIFTTLSVTKRSGANIRQKGC